MRTFTKSKYLLCLKKKFLTDTGTKDSNVPSMKKVIIETIIGSFDVFKNAIKGRALDEFVLNSENISRTTERRN